MQLVKDKDRRGWKYYHPIPAEQAGPHKDTHVKVQVQYVMGGTNYLTGTMNERGYRFSLTRVALGDHSESFVLMGGENGYIMLEAAKAFQQKKLDAWATKADPIVVELAERFLQKDKHGVMSLALSIGAAKPVAPVPAPPPPIKELLTEGLKKQLLAAGHTGQKAICKFFNPAGGGVWIVAGMDQDGDTLWCLADLGMDCAEEGTASLNELQGMRLPMGLHIERDVHFEPRGRTLGDFMKVYNEKHTLAGVS